MLGSNSLAGEKQQQGLPRHKRVHPTKLTHAVCMCSIVLQKMWGFLTYISGDATWHEEISLGDLKTQVACHF